MPFRWRWLIWGTGFEFAEDICLMFYSWVEEGLLNEALTDVEI